MYNVSVPVINKNVQRVGREKVLAELKRLDAKRVMLASGVYLGDENARIKEFKLLKENCEYFHANGLEVGSWGWTFWITFENEFQRMVGISGKESKQFICPSDEKFREFAGNYLKDIAKCGVDLILYDDDFRYGFLDLGMGCICPNHIKYMEEILGEKLDVEKLKDNVLVGGKNKYRDAWLSANGHFFEVFARDMRKAVDSVNPKVRIGICSCMSHWDNDGIDTYKTCKTIAGNTKPFMRLIGAPYWAVNKSWGNRLEDIIEIERMERSWCGDDMEIVAEGDVYPRPRSNTPASYLEIFDTALRADGKLDGILKYGIDYTSNAGYEEGYFIMHEKNRELYKKLEEDFANKKACGVRIYERMQKLADYEIPKKLEKSDQVQDLFFPMAAKIISNNSIPSVYEGLGTCGIAFNANIDIVSEDAFKKGMIIDIEAAKILMKKGIDVGIKEISEEKFILEEYFIEQNEYVPATNGTAFETKLKDNTLVLSEFQTVNPSDVACGVANKKSTKIPASFYYENESGYKFLVFTFSGYFNSEFILRSYARSLEIKTAIEKMGEKLPAYSYKNPDLYIMSKKDESSMSVGLWNAFADPIYSPVIELDKEYSEIEFINCNGKIEKNKVILSEMSPFSFAGFVVK